MTNRRVLLATRNAKKLVELRRIVDAAGLAGVEIVGLADVPEFPEAPETGSTEKIGPRPPSSRIQIFSFSFGQSIPSAA